MFTRLNTVGNTKAEVSLSKVTLTNAAVKLPSTARTSYSGARTEAVRVIAVSNTPAVVTSAVTITARSPEYTTPPAARLSDTVRRNTVS